jgi:hypothetical protein
VTLQPLRRLGPVPSDAVPPDFEDCDGVVMPHLDWIFVNRWMQRHGIATHLLDAVVNSLQQSGYRYLASTCLLCNENGLLWHWRSGFKMLPRSFTLRRPCIIFEEQTDQIRAKGDRFRQRTD